MSSYFSKKFSELVPYTPGEQPRDMQYIKLNTNESPYPPSPGVLKAVQEEAGMLQLYSDPTCKALSEKLAALYSVAPSQVIMTNGSDEALYFAFMAFADEERPLRFADITYGFYSVFADLLGIPYTAIPLKDDFTIDPTDYYDIAGNGQTVVIANPNAPTGICLSLAQIEDILQHNEGNVVIIDEAYVDFGGESAVSLLDRYENLLVTQTFSKSRSMAGARLGFAIGNEALISDLHTLRYSTNPYNVNRMTSAAGIAALAENEYYMENCKKIMETRELVKCRLESMGFFVIPSKTNFLFISHPAIDGRSFYLRMKEKGVLVRHFDKDRIREFNRVTIGTARQMELFLEITKNILEATP